MPQQAPQPQPPPQQAQQQQQQQAQSQADGGDRGGHQWRGDNQRTEPAWGDNQRNEPWSPSAPATMDDARAELQQVMQSADFRAFCSLCQEQGAAQDPFEICATFIGHRSKRRLEELDAQHRKAIGAQRDRLGELLSLREPGDDPEALHTQVNAARQTLTLALPHILTLTLTPHPGQRGAARDARQGCGARPPARCAERSAGQAAPATPKP